MPRNVNCKHCDILGKCERLPKTLFIFKQNCIKYNNESELCVYAERYTKPHPPPMPPHKEQIETLRQIEKHLSKIASCVERSPMHGTGNSIKTSHWND